MEALVHRDSRAGEDARGNRTDGMDRQAKGAMLPFAVQRHRHPEK